MQLESKKFLYDILKAAELLTEFARDKTFDEYTRDAMLRSAIERQLEIIGEAISQLAKIDPPCTSRISEHRRIIAFRNILIHGYAQVDDQVVWSVLDAKLPILKKEVEDLLRD